MSVELINVTKRFRSPEGEVSSVVAVDNVSLVIEEGEMVTLLGPSGCGKTTTLRIVAGFEMPDSGKVVIGGHDVTDMPPNKRNTAMVFQSYAIFPHLTVFENVAFGLRIRKLPQAEIEEKVGRMLGLVGLTEMARRSPDQLSGGQQQRVALARAIVNEPDVLLFDEPLSNLDAKLREQMRSEIRRIQQGLGITSLYVTHDQAEAMALSDRIVIMNEGRIAQVGSPKDIYDTPTDRFVAEFVGRANFLPAKLTGCSGDLATLDVMGRTINIDRAKVAGKPASSIELVVRPETVRLWRSSEADPSMARFAGKVRRALYMGSVAEYDVEVDGTMLLSVVTSPAEHGIFGIDEEVSVGFPMAVVHPLCS
ncbi:MAG: Spermidine/putrescine import ATP-binding protein PotA [Firmicutes bacterium ADurb.Bin153]|nr:MAG: Spermidine/putrescine import ATP-binding protein PotA [Firmicutes bacterium ADurb.Bin153]